MNRYRITPDALSASLDDGAVLLNLHTKRYYTLNETGTRIWALLEQRASRDEIVATLVREYEVSEGDAYRALQGLLDDLCAEHLLVTESSE